MRKRKEGNISCKNHIKERVKCRPNFTILNEDRKPTTEEINEYKQITPELFQNPEYPRT